MHARIVAFIPSPSSHECCHTIRTCCISIPMHNESSSNDEICYPIIPCSWRRLGSFPLYSHYTTDVACLNLVLRNQFSAQQFPLQSAASSTLNPPCLIRLLMIIRQWWSQCFLLESPDSKLAIEHYGTAGILD